MIKIFEAGKIIKITRTRKADHCNIFVGRTISKKDNFLYLVVKENFELIPGPEAGDLKSKNQKIFPKYSKLFDISRD